MVNKTKRSAWVWSTYTAMMIICLVVALFMQSCATAGYPHVDTTRKAILVANAEIRGANLLLQDLIRRNAIDNDSARDALNALRDGHENLRTALSAIDAAGDPLTAQTNLERANAALSIALTLLSQFAGEP